MCVHLYGVYERANTGAAENAKEQKNASLIFQLHLI